jgi:hypothetical protein
MLANPHRIPDSTVKIVSSVEEAIKTGFKKYGSNATISVIPEGPYTVPVI